MSGFVKDLDDDGRRLVRRNGRAKERRLTLGSGTVRLRAPRVDDRGRSADRGADALPEPDPAAIGAPLAEGLGRGACAEPGWALDGRLRAGAERAARRGGRGAVGELDLAPDRAVAPMLRGVRRRRVDFAATGTCSVTARTSRCASTRTAITELAVEDGYCESSESWARVMRDPNSRGMSRPRLVTGDGPFGIGAALRDVFPQARHQRCWVHKLAKVLDCLPGRHPQYLTLAPVFGAGERLVSSQFTVWAPFSSRFG